MEKNNKFMAKESKMNKKTQELIAQKVAKTEANLRKVFNRFFLWALRISVIELKDGNNWQELREQSSRENLAMLIIFLTHKDYLDGPVALASTDDEILQKIVVQKEGFGGKWTKIRNVVAKVFVPTIFLTKVSRPKQLREEMSLILSNLEPKVAITVFPTGTRDLIAPILSGIDYLVIQEMIIFLGIMLADKEPVFASKETILENIKSLFNRSFLNRQQSREFILKMNGLSGDDYEKMAEGRTKGKQRRKNITAKLEILRAYGVLKMFNLVGNQYPGERPHPLLQNRDNIPLLEKSLSLLKEKNPNLIWLCENTTVSSHGKKTYLDGKEVGDLLDFFAREQDFNIGSKK